MTYSLVAIDPDAGEIGVAVQSHYFGVGALVAWARPGVGVVATQSVVRAAYGPDLLDLLAEGLAPEVALQACLTADPGASLRQVAVMDATGVSAGHTGSGCIGAAGHATGARMRAQANLVVGPAVWNDIVSVFETAEGTLALRMLAALDAAEAAGGDLRGRQAAALHIVRTTATGDLAADTVLDLRVDDHPEPLAELRRLASVALALGGLVRMLETPGLLVGPGTASPHDVEQALCELDHAQTLLGAGNTEPTVWRGLLLARTGRSDEARRAFVEAAPATPALVPLLRSLAAAGMWPGPAAALVALAPPAAASRRA